MKKYEFTKEQRSIIEGMRQPFAVCQYLETGVVTLVVSDGFCEMFGYKDRAQAYADMNQNMFKDIHPDDTARFTNALLSFGAEGGSLEVLYRVKKKDVSGYKVIRLSGEHVYTDDGSRLAQVWFTEEGDYKEESGDDLRSGINSELQEENRNNAVRYDLLTGLPNLNCFFELAEVGRKKLLDHGGLPALLYIDLSGMKSYNHKYGFSEGDKLLRHFSRLLSQPFGTENCCHIGADRFSAIVDENGLNEKLNNLFQEWREMKNHMHLPICVGIYPYRLEAVPAGLAYDRAKIACDAIKSAYSSSFNYYSDDLSEGIVKQNYILENFERALSENWVKVYYQPIVRAISGKVCDEEALARWVDPVKGFLPPAEFIPYLEDAGLIYKLDLYVLEHVLKHMKAEESDGYYTVPHSINLSRSDFDVCDMVEEIKRRVDAAGISRDKISIEITESVLGSDFEYMKAQIERFRAQGFQVWMDDFGSGYSSLDVLQSVKFDLIKFDMGFMRRLNEGESGKIILTEMMKMATSLGVDTVCEGVETEEQLHFLQEIGCSKLQGYYFMKPAPPDQVLEKYSVKIKDGIEDPRGSAYYDTVGRVNLYDLSFLANRDDSVIRNTFDTVPMGIMELNREGDKVRYVRSNQSFRELMKRAFHLELSHPDEEYSVLIDDHGSGIMSAVEQCRRNDSRAFIDEVLDDGSVVHSFMRRIVRNPVNGRESFALAVLSVTEPDEKTMTYVDIARALAADYYNIFVIDLDTDDFIEYASQVGGEELSEKRRGTDFFESAKRDTLTRVYEEDRKPFLELFSKERVLQDLDRQGVFTTTYRLIDTGTPMYVNMKITRLRGGNRIILGISVVDAQMKQQEEGKRLRSEKISLGRIAALSPDYIVLYMVDPVTGHYTQFMPSNEYESVGLARQGEDFFADVVADSPKAIAPEDLERHLRVLTRENMLAVIGEDGFMIHNYRMLLDGKRVPVSLRATLIQENDGEKIILGITNDEEEYRRKLEKAYKLASSKATIYTHIAHALTRDYTDLYYVNMETDEFIAYHTDDERGVLNEARRGNDFFERCSQEVSLYVHPDDREEYLRVMNRNFFRETLDHTKVYELTFRRIERETPFYVQMKISRMEDDNRFIVLAISDVDELMRQRRAEERIQEERIIYARLHALTGNFIVVYVVDPETDCYREFSAIDDYVKKYAQAKEGTGFFDRVREAAKEFNYPEDLERFLAVFTKENILAEIGHNGIFTLGYRFLMDGRPVHVQMKAAMVEEKEGPRLIVGLNDIDAQVRQEEGLEKRLEQAQNQASIDALTGVKNKHAFLETEVRMDKRIAEHSQLPFAVVMFDVNDLKKVNDTAGHQTGDQYLRDASKVICDLFKYSPVFRVGGDEFAVIAHGEDYVHIEEIMGRVNDYNREAIRNGGIVIACGMSKYDEDDSVATVFERADHNMYDNKYSLKAVSDMQNR